MTPLQQLLKLDAAIAAEASFFLLDCIFDAGAFGVSHSHGGAHLIDTKSAGQVTVDCVGAFCVVRHVARQRDSGGVGGGVSICLSVASRLGLKVGCLRPKSKMIIIDSNLR